MPPLASFRSSGDFLADRRFEYARAAFEDGDHGTAADLARQALELAPAFAAAHALLGRVQAALGNEAAAIDSLRQALVLEPDDALGVRIELVRLCALPPDAAITAGYVRALFDDYAARFDRHLVRNLAYRGPELLAEALRSCTVKRMRPFRFRHAVDLGCGTGLMARALKGSFDTIDGVDLSPRMLAQARKTRLYRNLHEGDLTAFLETGAGGEADLVLAADVFVYSGDLARIFRAAHRALGRGGFFAFTVQASHGDAFVLGEDSRFAHGEQYLRDLGDKTGFAIITFDRVSTREDRGEPVPGFLAVLER
jgi:predicted TPR repeat methyltransferase